ncbi:MAG: carboxypeptidase regulatory-like domain-containing protein [Byssovorax sp.]
MHLAPSDTAPPRRKAWISALLLSVAMLLLPLLSWLLAPKVGGFVAPPPDHAAARPEQPDRPVTHAPDPGPRPASPKTPSGPAAGGPVTGTVLDPEGKPVSGATVGCDDRDKELSATTDKDGHFALPPQASGCKAVCHHPDFAATERTEIVAGRDNLLRLRGAGGIDGVVVDEKGAPVAAYLIAVESFQAAGDNAEASPPGGQAKNIQDPKGAFLLENLMPGKYILTASAEGRPPARSSSIDVEAGRTTHHVKIVLPKGAVLSGRVIDAETKKPVAGAVIGLDAITQTSANAIKPAKSDENGNYQLEGAPPGPFSIRVAQERYRTKIVPGLVTRGLPTLQQDVELSPRGDGGAGDSELAGIGAILVPQPKGVIISWMLQNGPAQDAGLRVGDVISRIDGLDAQGLTMSDCVQRLRGPEGSRVSVTVTREGEGTVEVLITRKNVVRN